MYYIGIDLGTSAVKLLMMDESGRAVRTVSKEYPVSYPRPGWSEQEPEDWFRQTVEGLKELTKEVEKKYVRGISIAGQMHGLVTLDVYDEVIRPAILWNDGRAFKETDYLNHGIGKETLAKYTANIAFTGFTAPKLLWMKENEPELFARIDKIMLPKDFLAYRLCGCFCTDYSDASGMLLLDVEHKCWSDEMLDICGIEKRQLPKLCESGSPVGYLRPSLAGETGFPEQVMIVAGAGDNAAAAVGTGTVGEGECNISLGTSGTVFISSRTFRADPNHALHAFAHADGGYHLMGCMLSAASCNKWWVTDILGETDLTKEQAGMDRLGENSVYYLPYLMGERSPHNDPAARGAFIGMTMDTKREQMTQAVLEGVMFALRDSLEVARSLGLTVNSTKICGGGAKSSIWKKMAANILNLQVETVENEEGPAYGAAILAAVGCGVWPDLRTASKELAAVREIIVPDRQLQKKYEMRYRQFRKLYPALKGFFADAQEAF